MRERVRELRGGEDAGDDVPLHSPQSRLPERPHLWSCRFHRHAASAAGAVLTGS